MNRLSLLNRPAAAVALSFFAGASLALSAPVVAQDSDTPSEQSESGAKEMTKGEKRLTKLLEGRVAGEPQSCIRYMPNESMQTIDKTAYVYGRGKTIYVQTTANPERIDDREVLVTRRMGASSQLCRQDTIRTTDPVSRISSGAVFFVDFIPYTRVEDEKDD